MIIPQATTQEPTTADTILQEMLDKMNLFYLQLTESKFAKDEKKKMKLWYKLYYGNDPISRAKAKDRKEFLKGLWGHLKDIGKGIKGMLKSMYGSWFTKLLKFLIFMAIIDPKGKLLMTLVDFLIKIGLWVLNTIFKMLPKIINALIFIITEVLPKVLNKIIDALFGFISDKLFELSKSVDSPMLKWILEQMSNLFAPTGTLATFFKDFGKYLIPLFIGLGVLVKLAPVFAMVGKVFGIIGWVLKAVFTIGKVIFGIFKAIWFVIQIISFITGVAVGWIVLIIAGVALIGVLVYKYWDEIKRGIRWFFDWIGDALSTAGKWLKKMWKLAPEWIGGIFSAIGTKIKATITKIFSGISGIFRNIFSALAPVFEKLKPVFEAIKKVLSPIGKLLKWVFNLIQNTIMKAFKNIKAGFDFVMSGFAMMADLSFKQLFNSKARSEYMDMREGAEAKGVNLGKVEKYMNKKLEMKDLDEKDKAFARSLEAQGLKRGKEGWKDATNTAGSGKLTKAIESVKTVKSTKTNKG